MQLGLIGGVVGLALAAVLPLGRRGRGLLVGGAVLAGLAAGAAMEGGPGASVADPSIALPTLRTDADDPTWLGSDGCETCHTDAYASWHDSYHRTMTQRAEDGVVLAPWEGTLSAGERQYHLLRDGDRFLVDMPAYGTAGRQASERVVREVVMTTGSHHMQIYWVEAPWLDDDPALAGEALYDARCARCHQWSGEAPEPVQMDVRRGGGGVVVHRREARVPPSLRGAELTPVAVEEAVADPGHMALLAVPLTPVEQRQVVDYTARLQLLGALHQVPFAWWVEDARWVHEDATFLQPPPGHGPVESYEQTWNGGCDQCHAVAPARVRAEGPKTLGRATELGIACEACHGAGRAHADHFRSPFARYAARLGLTEVDDIVNPAELPPDRASAVCGQCHGELAHLADQPAAFEPGSDLADWAHVVQDIHPRPEWLLDALEEDPDRLQHGFWRDGTGRVAGRDINAMWASGCAENGDMSCLSCHSLHRYESPDDMLAPGYETDRSCVECHPAVAAEGAAHHHHGEGSAGASCVNCHMPHTTLGLLKAIRSHRVTSPSVVATVQTGKPDACTLCHLDRSRKELAGAMTDWYGQPALEQVVVGSHDRSGAVDLLLRGDAAQRAVVAWHLGWGPALEASGSDWQAPMLAATLDDPYAAVRYIAGRSLRQLPGYEGLAYDYTSSGEARQAVADAVIGRWPGARPNPAVLVGPDGQIDQDTLSWFQLLRDDRPVVVSE